MKYSILTLFCLGTLNSVCAQNSRQIHDLINPKIFVIRDKIFFSPIDSLSSRSGISYCYKDSVSFYFDGFLITENDVVKLGLKQKNMLNKIAYYQYTYLNNDANNCAISMNFYTIVTLPVKLNGKSFAPQEIANKVQQSKLLSIKRISPLFKKSYIEILTH